MSERMTAGKQAPEAVGAVIAEDWFHDQGLHKLSGTIRYPKAA